MQCISINSLIVGDFNLFLVNWTDSLLTYDDGINDVFQLWSNSECLEQMITTPISGNAILYLDIVSVSLAHCEVKVVPLVAGSEHCSLFINSSGTLDKSSNYHKNLVSRFKSANLNFHSAAALLPTVDWPTAFLECV